MALSILGLSAVIRGSGLSYRALLWMLRIGPSHTAWYNFCLFLIGTVLTPVVPSANGRVSIVAPFVVDLLRAVPKHGRAGEAPRLTGNALGGASLLSPIFASSKSVNFVIFGMLPLQMQHQFHWFYWLQAAALCGVVLAALYGAASWWLFRASDGMRIPKDLVAEQQRLLGRLKPAEWAGIFGLAVLMLGFASAAIHRLDIPWIAMAILFCLLMFGFLGEEDFRKNIDWSFMIFLGALIGLSDSMQASGLESWLTSRLGWLGAAMTGDFMIFVALLAAVIFVIRLALPINATTVILAGLLIPSAVGYGVNPWVIGFLVLLFSESFVWPYQASYFGQFNSITGPIAGADDRRLHTLNMATAVFKVLAVFATIPYWRSLGLL
jgi:DASS family divalent anion:Na+ symporter